MNSRDDWNELLRTCDFEMTACEIRGMLKMWKEDAASSGQEPFYNTQFLAVLYPFLKTPSLDTAVSLLEVAPATYPMFEKCSPGGEFYEAGPRPAIVTGDTRLLGLVTFGIAELVAPTFARVFTANSKPTLEEVLPRIKLELCALYLHLLDRDAFLEAGKVAARNHFADSLFRAISSEVEEKLGVDPGDFNDLCNARQVEFSRYKELIAPWGELGGTLFWEFGKELAFRYQAYNPIALQAFILAATDGYISLIEAVKKLKT